MGFRLSTRIIRKTVKWGGLTLAIMLLVLWIGSGWVWIGDRGENDRRWWWSLTIGRFNMGEDAFSNGNPGDDYHFLPLPSFGFRWLPRWEQRRVLPMSSFNQIPALGFGAPPMPNTILEWKLQLPLWIPILLVLVPTGAAWFLDSAFWRDRHLNRCKKCRYDRTGLPAGAVCPECGSP